MGVSGWGVLYPVFHFWSLLTSIVRQNVLRLTLAKQNCIDQILCNCEPFKARFYNHSVFGFFREFKLLISYLT